MATEKPAFFDYEESKSKHMHYKAEIEKAHHDEILGKLAPMDSIIAHVRNIGSDLRASFEHSASRLAPRLVHESDEITIQEIIEDEFVEIRSKIKASFEDADMVQDVKKIGKEALIKNKRVAKRYK